MARADLVLAVAAVLAMPFARADDREAPPKPEKTEERRVSALASAFSGLARQVAPSVVAVRTGAGDELGFGVAIDGGRFILTSRTILEGAGDILRVTGPSGEGRPAAVLARNEAYDVALLKLGPGVPALPAIAFGSSRKLEVGQWVVTVGTDAGRPLAVGVVSALDRRVEPRAEARALDLFGLFSDSAGPRRPYARVIQHDSPLDGDRGGAPLVDADGRLVGINVANAYRGSAYAAPLDDIATFLDELKAGRPGPPLPRPGYIGVSAGAVKSRALADELRLEGGGTELHEVAEGLPAAKAGLVPGDVILEVNGEKGPSLERFGRLIRATDAGKPVRIRVLRGRQELEVTVVAAPRADDE